MELNKLITFEGVTELAFHAIFRRSLLIKIKSRFLDADYVRDHVPDAAKYGLFPRQPDLKQFLSSEPAVAAGLKMQHAFEEEHGELGARRHIDD